MHGEERERFFHEGHVTSALDHTNICVIHEIDEVNDETFLVMEYIDGISVRGYEEIFRNREVIENLTFGKRPGLSPSFRRSRNR